ncbi:Mis12 domain protein [Cladophialophora carrionii]|uniref:Mis12 domain protein n=1 Tax=Cladophialophora carrionii TaxID=86049 RepID=A0A1C1CMR0_9EURO|nr:Mis12 domain protein [Cladophialophora carrionii]
MADSSQAATSLLTEHLQYTPLSLIDDIINSVNNLVLQVLGSLETGLLTTPPEELGFQPVERRRGDGAEDVEFTDAKQEIEEGLHKLETLLYSTVDKNFDKFEIYVLRNIMSVPADLVNWVRLSHYEVSRPAQPALGFKLTAQNLSYPPPKNAPTVDSVQVMRSKLAAGRNASRALLKEYNRNQAIIQQLRSLLGQTQATPDNLSFLANSTQAQSLTTNTHFAISQLPALQTLLTELRPKLAALKHARINVDSAKDELKEERRDYIEQRTRSHLRRNGEDLQEQSAAIAGKRVESEEVQALENVAAIFDPE